MILDFAIIRKLTPPGLLNVAGLLMLVDRLLSLVEIEAKACTASLKLARQISRALRQLRDAENYNLNKQIRMWVLQSTERRAWVRDMIGERAIQRWHKRSEVLSGNTSAAVKTTKRKPASAAHTPANHTPYRWRQFVLPRLMDTCIKRANSDIDWNIDYFADNNASAHSGTIRPYQSTEFWLFELSPDYTLPTNKQTPETTMRQQTKRPLNKKPPEIKIPASLYQYFTNQECAQLDCFQQNEVQQELADQLPCGP